jgi:hypothetical protein
MYVAVHQRESDHVTEIRVWHQGRFVTLTEVHHPDAVEFIFEAVRDRLSHPPNRPEVSSLIDEYGGRECEGCGDAATGEDIEGVPLCGVCGRAVAAES